MQQSSHQFLRKKHEAIMSALKYGEHHEHQVENPGVDWREVERQVRATYLYCILHPLTLVNSESTPCVCARVHVRASVSMHAFRQVCVSKCELT